MGKTGPIGRAMNDVAATQDARPGLFLCVGFPSAIGTPLHIAPSGPIDLSNPEQRDAPTPS